MRHCNMTSEGGRDETPADRPPGGKTARSGTAGSSRAHICPVNHGVGGNFGGAKIFGGHFMGGSLWVAWLAVMALAPLIVAAVVMECFRGPDWRDEA